MDAVFHRVAVGDIGTLCNDFLEEPLASVDEREEGNTCRACRLTEDRHVVRIAAESCNVFLYPSERFKLVEQTEVACLLEVFSARNSLEVHKSQEAETVVDRHKQDVGILFGDVGKVVEWRCLGFGTESAAMYPHHNRLFAVGAGGIAVYVKHKAVLAELCCSVRVVQRSNGNVAGLCCIVHSVIICGRKRLLPAKFTHRLSCVGDALIDDQLVRLLANESAVAALDSQRLVVIAVRDSSVLVDVFCFFHCFLLLSLYWII